MEPLVLRLIRLPLGAELLSKVSRSVKKLSGGAELRSFTSHVNNKTGTEVAYYITAGGRKFKKVAYGAGNKGAQALGMRGYVEDLGTGLRTLGFEAKELVNADGIPFRTSITRTAKELTLPLARLVGKSWAGVSPRGVVKDAANFFKFLDQKK